jgi:hypothetical protein
MTERPYDASLSEAYKDLEIKANAIRGLIRHTDASTEHIRDGKIQDFLRFRNELVGGSDELIESIEKSIESAESLLGRRPRIGHHDVGSLRRIKENTENLIPKLAKSLRALEEEVKTQNSKPKTAGHGAISGFVPLDIALSIGQMIKMWSDLVKRRERKRQNIRE